MTLIHPHAGSIPACAGEPTAVSDGSKSERVYPRVCGGTIRRRRELVQHRGLSPRVRGNRVGRPGLEWSIGSIPACAGEPWISRGDRIRGRVYPRVCGGTHQRAALLAFRLGLSPRVRGNP